MSARAEVETKERPILFSAPMVRAILDARKTQTRRVVLLKPWMRRDGMAFNTGEWVDPGLGGGAYLKIPRVHDGTAHRLMCPYGGIGDRLRWASRLTLEITGVRVERLQQITRDDAIAEGPEQHDDDGVTYYGDFGKGHADPRSWYRSAWDAVNASRGYPWSSNPWVWVLSFRRLHV